MAALPADVVADRMCTSLAVASPLLGVLFSKGAACWFRVERSSGHRTPLPLLAAGTAIVFGALVVLAAQNWPVPHAPS